MHPPLETPIDGESYARYLGGGRARAADRKKMRREETEKEEEEAGRREGRAWDASVCLSVPRSGLRRLVGSELHHHHQREICSGGLIPITPLRGDMGAANSPPSCLPARVHPYGLQTGPVRHHIAAVTSSLSFQVGPNPLSSSI
jgi:hypothetical protein